MIDTLLKIACAFDWITPTAAFVQDAMYGPISDFGVPADAGWTADSIRSLLSRYGVKVWGLMLSPDGETLMFTVKKAQAKWTYYVLQMEGIPILSAPAEAVDSAPRRRPTGETDPATPITPIFDFLDGLFKDFE